MPTFQPFPWRYLSCSSDIPMTCPVATGSPGFHHQRLQALRPPQTATSLPRQGCSGSSLW